MRERLRALKRALTFQPKLASSNGMVVAVAGTDVVQFPDDTGAPFFVAAAESVEALCDEADELERRVRELHGIDLDAIAARTVALDAELARERARNADLEHRMTIEVAARTHAENTLRDLQARIVRAKLRHAGNKNRPGNVG